MSLVVISYCLKSLKIPYENGRVSVVGRPTSLSLSLSLSLAPPLAPQISNKISKTLKKISYHSHRNFLQPQIVKNLLRKWSRFCKNIL
jgi:hypothetical protein